MFFLSCIKEKRRIVDSRNTSGSFAAASTTGHESDLGLGQQVANGRSPLRHPYFAVKRTEALLLNLANNIINSRVGGMRFLALCILLLAVSEPLLSYAKVLVIVPRHVRRTPSVSWRPPSHYKKSSYSGSDSRYYGRVNRYRKPNRPLPYGGDDFDHGIETINHVNVPYGKDISHAVTFGKGYIPYDKLRSSLPVVPERYASAYGRQPAIPDYPSTSSFTSGQDYATSATAHSYENPQIDSFFSDMENAARSELRSSLKDNVNKYYGTRSIEKDLSLRNQQALSSIIEKSKDSLTKGTESFTSDASPAAYAHIATAAIPSAISNMHGAVIMPAGIPPATIAGNKDGIVLRDTVSLDDYQKKLEELTKTWPSLLSAGTNFVPNSAIAAPQQLHPGFTATSLPGINFGGSIGGANWLSNFAQSKQGYAVREDHGDPTTYDFRTMTVQAPYQQLSFSHGDVSAAGIIPSAQG